MGHKLLKKVLKKQNLFKMCNFVSFEMCTAAHMHLADHMRTEGLHVCDPCCKQTQLQRRKVHKKVDVKLKNSVDRLKPRTKIEQIQVRTYTFRQLSILYFYKIKTNTLFTAWFFVFILLKLSSLILEGQTSTINCILP